MSYEHEGHRMRMLKKLQNRDLLEAELLEVLLYPVLPRVNTADVAHRLIAKYQTLEGLFNASMEELAALPGVGQATAAAIFCMGRLSERYAAEVIPHFMGLFSVDEFLKYTKFRYADEKKEVLDFYFLDEKGYIVSRKRLAEGNAIHMEVDTHKISKIIVNEDAAGVVLVHNHPMGYSAVSEEDDRATRVVQLICSTNNVLLCDHIVFGPNGAFSYYQSGRLPHINRDYSLAQTMQDKIVQELSLEGENEP